MFVGFDDLVEVSDLSVKNEILTISFILMVWLEIFQLYDDMKVICI